MESQDTTGILEEFQTEFISWWRQIPNKGFFFILLAAWLLLFQLWGNATLGYVHTPSLFAWMLNAYRGKGNEIGDDSHGMLIPFVVLALFWWKRKELMKLRLETWWPGFLLVVLALVLHIAGYVIQQSRVSIVALFIGIYGLMGLAWGYSWLRASFFPYFLVVFCVPLGSLAEPITFRLRLMVSESVEFISNSILAIDVMRQGTALINPTGHYEYEVAAACAGMRSLIAVVGLAIVYSFMSYSAWWKRCLIVAAAFPLAVLGNLVRMMMIILAATFWGQNAGNYVHEGGPMGIISLLPYVIPFAGLLMIGHWIRERTTT